MYGRSFPLSKRAVPKLRIDEISITPLKYIPWRSWRWLTSPAAPRATSSQKASRLCLQAGDRRAATASE